MKKTIVNYKSSPPRTSEKMSHKKKNISKPKQNETSFKVQKLDKDPFGYKYNVQTYFHGVYSGYGLFCRNMNEVNAYKKSIKSKHNPAAPVKGKTK